MGVTQNPATTWQSQASWVVGDVEETQVTQSTALDNVLADGQRHCSPVGGRLGTPPVKAAGDHSPGHTQRRTTQLSQSPSATGNDKTTAIPASS